MLHHRCEISPHIVQCSNFPVDRLQAIAPHRDDRLDFMRLPARGPRQSHYPPMDFEKLLDLRQGKTKLLIALDEDHAFEISRIIATVPRRSSRRSRQQALPLVKPDRLNVDMRAASQLSDMHFPPLNPAPENKARKIVGVGISRGRTLTEVVRAVAASANQ